MGVGDEGNASNTPTVNSTELPSARKKIQKISYKKWGRNQEDGGLVAV